MALLHLPLWLSSIDWDRELFGLKLALNTFVHPIFYVLGGHFDD